MHVNSIVCVKHSRVITVGSEQTVQEALNLFTKHKIGFAAVVDQFDTLVGTLSERDVCQALQRYKAPAFAKRIGAIMTENIVTCKLEDELPVAVAHMQRHRTRHALIMLKGKMVGVVSIGDVVKAWLEDKLEKESMPKRINGVSSFAASGF